MARASVAIARAIQGIEPGTGCIVFDESTQSLPRAVLGQFYAQVRRLAATGTSVLIVSHRLDEVLALCGRVTVLEDGAVTLAGQPTRGMTEASLGRVILGRSRAGQEVASGTLRSSTGTTGDIALDVQGLTGGAVQDMSFTVRAGEVVGMIGDADSGYDAVPYLIA